MHDCWIDAEIVVGRDGEMMALLVYANSRHALPEPF
jgi:hypothetical protein